MIHRREGGAVARNASGQAARPVYGPLLAVLALIGAATLYLILYLDVATLDVAYADYLLPPFITAVDACSGGGDCLRELTAPTSNGYRWTLPTALLSANAAALGLTARFEQALGIAGLGGSALILHAWLSGTWMRSARRSLVVLASATCIFFLFNLNQWDNLVLGIGGYHLLGIVALLSCLWAVDRSLRKSRLVARDLVLVFMALVIAAQFLLQYFLALVIAVVLVALAALAAGVPNARKVLAAAVAASAAGLLLTLDLARVIGQWGADTGATGLDFRAIAGFGLNMLAAAMIQWEGKRILAGSGLFLGVPALVAVGLSMWLFVTGRMYRESWLPLALMLYVLLVCLLVSTARFHYGQDYGFVSRYATQTTLAFIGCFLVLLKKPWVAGRGRVASALVAVFCLAAVALQLATHVVQWEVAPYRKKYYQEMERVAARVERASDADLALFQVPPQDARQALAVLRRHHLAYFRQ